MYYYKFFKMKSFIIFIVFSISFVTCEGAFGQRLSASKNSTLKESVKPEKDLNAHESFRTYEFALPPIEVQSHYPRVIAEEHTIHELAPLKPALPIDEPIISKEPSHPIAPQPEYLYTPKHMPKHYGQDLPIYRDNPTEHLKGHLPVHREPSAPLPQIESIQSLPPQEYYPNESLPPNEYHPSQSLPPLEYHPKQSLPPNEYHPSQSLPPIEYHPKQSLPSNEYHPNLSLPPLEYHPKQSLPQIEYQPTQQDNEDIGHFGYIAGIPGTPWKDYPLFHSIPYTNFKCGLTKFPGFYADIETGCQVWHYCQLDGRHDRFLCANGTLFNQKTRVCDWWYNVDCQSSLLKYDINRDLYSVPHQNYIHSDDPLNHPQPPLHQLPLAYQSENDPYSGQLIFAETQSLPKKIVKRIGKVRVNNTDTESDLLDNKNSN